LHTRFNGEGGDGQVNADAQDRKDDFGSNVLEEMMSLWIEPELLRRDIDVDGFPLTKAVVVMTPGRPVEVRINDEVEWVAHLPARRVIEKGEEITTNDVDLSQLHWLRPAGLDDDVAWTGFVRIGDEVLISFDFRRNRARAGAMMLLARDFLATARLARNETLLRPAVENLYAAAELAVVAQMYLQDDYPTRSHLQRRRQWRKWTELGNAPEVHSRCLARLARARASARYAEGRLRIKNAEVEVLAEVVAEMIDLAEANIGDPAAEMPVVIQSA